MKDKIKDILLQKLHAVEKQTYDVTEAIVTRGISGFVALNYDNLQKEVMEYVKSMEITPFTYKYAASCDKPCLYASIYAVMLEGLFNVLKNRDKYDLKAWGEYLNSFQHEEDGLYYDPALEGPAYNHIGSWNEGWGKYHLMGHIIIALARLGETPKYPLTYLEKFYNTSNLINWMESFDFSGNVWTVSNYFMNLYTVLEYARDFMGENRAVTAVDTIAEWLLKKQNPATGMWHDRNQDTQTLQEKFNIVRAAYHFYPLFEYENIDVPFQKEIVEFILPLQNSWGGWTFNHGNAGACEDIDAIEPLLRFATSAPDKATEIKEAVTRSIIWQLSSRNADKGFSFYVRSSQEYGGHPLTSSLRDESSMFATWFRTLCLAYEMRYLNIPNKFNIGRFPGYEIR